MNTKHITIGVDIGGSHVTCAAIDMAAGKLIPQTKNRASVNHQAEAEQILDAWASAINATISQIDANRLAGIGFAIPGPFNYREGISQMQHKFARLYNVKIADLLIHKLNVDHHLPMRFLNDATSFAVGEAWLGLGKGFNRVIAITLGTGFGSAFIDRGIPVTQGKNVPKEGCLWHLPYASGIADEYFSTRWFTREYERISGQKLPNVKALAEAAEEDTAAKEVFVQFANHLTAFLVPWFRTFQADRLVIGGNIARAYALFGPVFEENLREKQIPVSIALSKLGEQAALIGSARLFEAPFWEQIKDQLPAI